MDGGKDTQLFMFFCAYMWGCGIWEYGDMVILQGYGDMDIWCYGDLEIWKFADMEIQKYGEKGYEIGDMVEG